MSVIAILLKILGWILTVIGLVLTILMFRGLWPSLLYPVTLLAGIILVMMGYAIKKHLDIRHCLAKPLNQKRQGSKASLASGQMKKPIMIFLGADGCLLNH